VWQWGSRAPATTENPIKIIQIVIRHLLAPHVPQAAAALDAAAGEAEQLGMVPFTRRIGQLRARLPTAAAARSPLSPRELEVARLVGRGLTNKQIGETLYLSERTAENHVRHILVKLGFSNRSQIAAWSSEEPATDAPSARD